MKTNIIKSIVSLLIVFFLFVLFNPEDKIVKFIQKEFEKGLRLSSKLILVLMILFALWNLWKGSFRKSDKLNQLLNLSPKEEYLLKNQWNSDENQTQFDKKLHEAFREEAELEGVKFNANR